MDPYKQVCKVKEQVAKEHEARRNFSKKWIQLADPELNKFYNQNEINKQLKGLLKTKDLCPFTHTGQGDSYFVSPEMYNSLVAKCRCTRPRSEAHILKCVQKAKDQLNSRDIATADDNKINAKNPPAKEINELPKTSNATFGWQRRQPIYKQWESSMKYVSPVATMPGQRVTAMSYHALFIG